MRISYTLFMLLNIKPFDLFETTLFGSLCRYVLSVVWQSPLLPTPLNIQGSGNGVQHPRPWGDTRRVQ